jgi:hypothetical protein
LVAPSAHSLGGPDCSLSGTRSSVHAGDSFTEAGPHVGYRRVVLAGHDWTHGFLDLGAVFDGFEVSGSVEFFRLRATLLRSSIRARPASAVHSDERSESEVPHTVRTGTKCP